MSDIPQVDYRGDPSFGDRAVPQGGPSYDRPIEPCAIPVAPQPNMQHQLTPEETALELNQPSLKGFSPDSDQMLRWERERSGFG